MIESYIIRLGLDLIRILKTSLSRMHSWSSTTNKDDGVFVHGYRENNALPAATVC